MEAVAAVAAATANYKKWVLVVFLVVLILLLLLLLFAGFSITHGQFFQDPLNKEAKYPSLKLNQNFSTNWKLKDLSEEISQLVVLNSTSTPFQWLKSIVLALLGGTDQGHIITTHIFPRDNIEPEPESDRTVISPNLSTCHTAMATKTDRVYCCPPKRESTEPLIDFQFPDPASSSTPLRIRRPAHLLDEKYLEKYAKAIRIMKSLPYDDPRSYKRQADVHCIYCIGAYNEKHSDFGLNIHRSWLFFPWHRMMIYFHERILAKLIQDDTFALPFWQWDAPQGMMMPHYYMKEPFFDSNRDKHHFPSKVADINYNFVEPTIDNEALISKNLAFMYNQMVSGAKKTELFMGCPKKVGEKGQCNGPGTIELAPHNALHSWVGDKHNPSNENMGVFYSAARDPLFYAHHSNIDRLWEVWRNLNQHKLDIVDPDWMDSYFYFHDENAQLVRIKIRDVLNITNLGYMYEQVDLPWLNARPKPSTKPKHARIKLNTIKSDDEVDDEEILEGKTLDRNVRIRVRRPGKKEKKEVEEVLVVYGIDVKKDAYVKFDVLVNAVVDDDGVYEIGPESREFAGTFVNVRRGVTLVMEEGDREVLSRKTDLKLGISELLEDLEADEDESIWVTLVPRGGTGIYTTVDGIRIEYMV